MRADTVVIPSQARDLASLRNRVNRFQQTAANGPTATTDYAETATDSHGNRSVYFRRSLVKSAAAFFVATPIL